MNDSDSFKQLACDLCAFSTGVVANDNEALFKYLVRELSFKIYRYGSDEIFNGWVVPKLWSVQKALLYRDGEVIFDGRSHTLGVGYYSRSFSGDLDWEILKTHLVTNPKLPEAYMFHCMWQYRPWAADWAFCIPYQIYKTLGSGQYRIELETTYEPGEMLVGEYTHKGRSPATIIFQNNTCHPHQANDGFAATAILVRLFQWLQGRDTYYTYKLLLNPEHTGTVFYLRDRSPAELDNLIAGIFMEMPGTTGVIKATSTFLGNLPFDQVIGHALRHYSKAYECVPWRKGAGNDETVWEAPGYEVPFVEITRCIDQFDPYPEYHSSLDTPDRIDWEQSLEIFSVFQHIINILENNQRLYRQFDGLLCLSNPKYNLYLERPDPSVVKDLDADSEKWGHLLDCLLRYFDGSMTILDIADRHDLPFDRLYQYLLRFYEKSLIRMEFVPLPRPARSSRA